jgi:hypothetical protein
MATIDAATIDFHPTRHRVDRRFRVAVSAAGEAYSPTPLLQHPHPIIAVSPDGPETRPGGGSSDRRPDRRPAP